MKIITALYAVFTLIIQTIYKLNFPLQLPITTILQTRLLLFMSHNRPIQVVSLSTT